ncbi:MAG: SRPBCC domain-containing protein [Candidatus Bathyarchaeota archaeon]|nr:MAG: SRPBCC domain-containing protein [Candidatus Bathyarchaeota archaeon]
MDRIIWHSISLRCSPNRAFELFTINKHLERWLAKVADVELRIGGKYELFWNPNDKVNDSTIGCKILAMAVNKFICFEWKGPKQFKHFMNQVRPLTNVVVFFTPNQEYTDADLLHTGWRDSAEWEEARQWFEKAWTNALLELKDYAENS